MEQRQTWLEDHQRLLASSRVERFAYADVAAKDKDTLREMLVVWLSLWRDVLLRASGANAPLTNLDRGEEIEALAGRLGLQSARQAILAVERTLDLLNVNANSRLVVEVLMLDLPHVSGLV